MDKLYLFSERVSHAVKVSMMLTIALLLFAFGQAAVGHESGFSPTGANAPNRLATNIKAGINKSAPAPKALAIPSGFKSDDVVYNGTTAYIIDLDVVLPGSDPDDVVKLTEITGTFADKNVGDGKVFTIASYKLEGGLSDEYSLSTTSIKVDIDPLELAVIGISVDPTKVYDGTNNATIVNSLAAHFLSTPMLLADNVKLQRLGPIATFDNKNVGNGKTVTVSGFAINTANEYNYVIKPSSLIYTANITPMPLTVSATCLNKQFDASDDATVSLIDNRVAGDLLTIDKLDASFESDDAGTAKLVTVSGITITGTDADNYSFNTTANTTANITPKEITISGVVAEDKEYDGNNRAMLSGSATLVGILGDDKVTLVSGIGSFADEDAGENKDVVFSGYSISGSNNYILKMQPVTEQADIEKKLLNISVLASDRDYDATTTAVVTFTDDRLTGDILQIHSAPVNFADKNVGVDKPIMVTGIYIDGDYAKDYSVLLTASTKASIKPIYLTISDAKAKDKIYDGLKTAELDIDEAALAGKIVASDNVILNISEAIGNFDTKNVGVGKTVAMNGFKISSPNDINYIITQPSAMASISPRHLSLDAVGVDKGYDGKTIAEVVLTPDPIDMVTGDVLNFTYNADFATKNMGAQAVNVKNIVITGVNAGNYALEATTETTSAKIDQKVLSVDAVANNKVYDGDVDADAEVTLTPDPSDLAAGDVLTLGFTDAHFSDKYAAIGKTVTVEGITIKTGNTAGNYILEATTETPKADITPLKLTVDASVLGKVYNSNTDVVENTVTLTSKNKVGNDDLIYDFDDAAFSDEHVGDRTVLVEGIAISGTDALNYSLQNVTTTAAAKITPKDLTVVAKGVNKEYDGANKAIVTFTTSDLIAGDALDYDYTATFSDKNVDETGATIPVAVTGIALKGNDAVNYKLTNVLANTTAIITPHELTMTGITADDKLYNGNTVAVLHSDNAILADLKHPELNLIALDQVKLIKDLASGEFVDKMAGDAKPITVSGFTIVGDPNEYNYILTQPSLTAKITPVPLRITGVTAMDKEYDGDKDAELVTTGAKLIGVLGSDIVTLESVAAKGMFADKNAIEYQVVTTSGFTLLGADKDNYAIPTYPKAMASITPDKLTLTATGIDKIYNGKSDDAVVTFGDWVEGNDNVSITYNASFANENAGLKNITVSNMKIVGLDAANYNQDIALTAVPTATIKPHDLKIKGLKAANKVYDHTITATLNNDDATLVLDVTDLVSDDAVTLIKTGATGTFEDLDVAAGIAVASAGFAIEGDDATNYALLQPTTIADITPAPLTISDVTANNKIYDGTDAAILNLDLANLEGVFESDDVTLISDGVIGNFDNKTAAVNKTVTVKGFTIEGSDAENYSLPQTESVKADISKRTLAISAVVDDKVYDGSTNAIISNGGLFMGNIVSSDKGATVSAIAKFEDKDVDENVTVNVTGITVGGPDASNYTYNTTTTTTADITPAPLKITGLTANNKVYDGSTLATLSDPKNAQVSGVKLTDNVKLVYYNVTSRFTDKNVGTNKSVLTTGFDIEGIDVVNYNLEQPSPIANISAIVLTIPNVTTINKVYDGKTTATLDVTSATLVGTIVPNELVSLNKNGANGTFADKNVGTAKIVTVNGLSLTGADAGNYLLANTTTTAAVNITPMVLAVSAVGVDKPYNGLTNATVKITDNRVAGDVLTMPYTATFNNKNVGTAKPVTVNILPMTGTDAMNYTLGNMTASTTANITSAGLALTITGVTAASKVYDGTTVATLNTTAAALTGVISPDVVTMNSASATGAFADKNVGIAKVVTTAGFVLAGADAGNYTLITPTMTTNITAKQLNITPNSISKCFGTSTTLVSTAIVSTGLVGSDAVTGVTLMSNGTPATANVGTFDIVASNAVGTGLSNYTFNYVNGTITVNPAQVAPIITVDAALQVKLTSNATTGNQWYNTAGAITGATAQTYTATSNSNYYVMVTGNCATLQSNTINVTHVSIPEFEKSAINVYPNPNTGEFWLNFKASGNEKLKMIQVYNRLGKAVYQTNPTSISNEITEWISIKNQPAGVYILVLTTDNQRFSRQIVITK